jgi:uncharacterized protein YeaO (DUF488 family)
MPAKAKFGLKRVYDPPEKSDGARILVDRLWPRGISRDKAQIDLWLKDIAPSTALRQWFAHDPARWREFKRRYRAELKRQPQALSELAQHIQFARGQRIRVAG